MQNTPNVPAGIQQGEQRNENKLAGTHAFEFPATEGRKPQVNQEETENPQLAPGSKDIRDVLKEASQSSDPIKYLDFYSKVNNQSEDQRKRLFSEYQRGFEKEENRLARENAFRDFAKNATGTKYGPDDLNRLMRYSENYLDKPSQTQKLFLAERDLQKYNNAISALGHARKAPNFWENLFQGQGQSEKQLQSAFKPLVELGEIDEAKKIGATLGFGPLRTERLVNPLNQQAKSVLEKIPKITGSAPLLAGVGSSGAEAAQRSKMRQKSLSKLPDLISEAVHKGGKMTSLKLIRDDLFKKGYLEHEFATALTQAIQDGLILSDYQIQEQAELGRPQRRPFLDIFFSDEEGSLGRSLRGYE
jgi:hypothetical protein